MRCLILGLVFAVGALPCSMAFVPRIWAKKPGAESRLFAFEQDGKTGFIDATGRIVIPATLPMGISGVGTLRMGWRG